MIKSNFHRIIIDRDRYHMLDDIMTWCSKNIGAGGRVESLVVGMHSINWGEDLWVVKTTFGVSTFAFRDNKDAVLFALRWGC